MGTGVGEAALAAEAFGAAEAAGAVAGAGGIAEAGLLGGEFAGGLGLTGGLTEGLGSMAGLGGEYGGLSSLSPAFQTATAGTAAFNPETTAQVMQAVNPGAVPAAGTPLGTGQVGYIGDVGGTGASAGLPFPTGGQAVTPPMISPATTTEFANADFLAPSPEGAAWDAATAGDYGGQTAREGSSFSFGNPFKSIYDKYKEQDPLTQGVMKYGGMGLGALQAAKYLNKPQGVAAPEKYSGPLSKFSYNPSTYTPYTYKPYAAGGPVEEMSRENALGANTGYPQADINQGAYATPWQMPVSRNVVSGPGDANVDQMTGVERLAEGGQTDAKEAAQPAPVPQAGLAALAPAAQVLPAMLASRQNFADFLARYQDMPVSGEGSALAPTDTSSSASSPVQYTGLTATAPGQGSVNPGLKYGSLWLGPPGTLPGNPVDPMSEGGHSGALMTPTYAAGGVAALAPAAQALPAVAASRQNFADFLARYQDMPVSEGAVAAPATTYTGLTYTPPGGVAGENTGAASEGSNNTGGSGTWPEMYLYASGGMTSLGGYSDGGRLLRGPGDGMSDNIPANISGKQPARLADGEFVVPADVVSGLGNGSTDAGAKQLYKMLDKVRSARTGTKKQGKQINPSKYTPA